ncbi:MAG: hypothetical protein KDI46_00005 [Alphaproteobacteria bacterium]|nr:hypothetical protein [Alphaproteobacteria bacterium]
MVQELLKGFRKFREEEYEGAKASMPRLAREGQSPSYFIISCIDSRTNPGTIFRPAPGTFFASKAMGAIVLPYQQGSALSAALKFVIEYNKIHELIILGHTDCGAIKSLISGIDDEDISRFLNIAQTGLTRAREKCATCSSENLQRRTEEEIVLQSIENLKTYPSVAKALEEKRIRLRPWIFDMENGELFEYCENAKEFKPITHNEKHEEEQ